MLRTVRPAEPTERVRLIESSTSNDGSSGPAAGPVAHRSRTEPCLREPLAATHRARSCSSLDSAVNAPSDQACPEAADRVADRIPPASAEAPIPSRMSATSSSMSVDPCRLKRSVPKVRIGHSKGVHRNMCTDQEWSPRVPAPGSNSPGPHQFTSTRPPGFDSGTARPMAGRRYRQLPLCGAVSSPSRVRSAIAAGFP